MLSTHHKYPVRGELHLAPFLHEAQDQLLGILQSHPDSGLRSLLSESHPGILFSNLFVFAGNQEQKNQEELAKKIYKFLSQNKEVPQVLAKKCQERLDVLNEGGPAGLWLERWTRKGLYEMTSTKLILEMTLGGMGARVGRVAGGLLARAGGMGALGTWLLPRAASFLSETAAFSGASLALTKPFPENPVGTFGQIFRSSGLMFASMRLSRALLPGSSALQASAATYFGIVGNHIAQQNLFHWEQAQDLSAMMRQSLAEAVTFSMGGHLTQLTMGRLLRPLEHSLDLAAARNERPLLESVVPAFAGQGNFSGIQSILSNIVFTKSKEGGPGDPINSAGGRGGTQLIGPDDGLATAETVEATTPPPQTAVVRKDPTVQGEATSDPALAGTIVATPEEITPAPPGVRPIPLETPAPPPLPRDLMPTVDAPPDSQRTPRPTAAPMSYAEIGIGSRLGELVKGEPRYEGELVEEEHRYEVVALLGEGGQGMVWKVLDHKMEKAEAVIKVLRGGAKPETIERQKREIQLGTHLKNKTDKIAAVYDVVDVGGIKVPVYKYVEGKPLDVILNKIHDGNEEARKTYSVKKLTGIFVQIADAVEELHNLSVMHRDLKPANIMVNEKGQVCLVDLGIGKVFEEIEVNPQRRSMVPPSLPETAKQNLTEVGHFFGTQGFWSPEILQPESYPTDNPRSYDVFALGAILYEMITGVPAFAKYERGDPSKGKPALVPMSNPEGGFIVFPYSVLQIDKSMEPPAFKDVVTQELDPISLELEAVARKATAPQPKDRYQSAEELSRAVQMAFARVEKRRLNQMQEEMDQARAQIQKDSADYRQVEISQEMWDRWNAPVRFLQSHHEAWHVGGQNLVERILTTMKGEEWPEGKHLIAQVSWERLLDLGHRINPAVRKGLVQKIRENDLPLDGKISGMKEALDGKVPINFKVTDYLTNKELDQEALIRVFPYEKELDAQGLETGNYRQGKFIYHGPIKDGHIPVDLPEGFYVFKIYSRGYAVSPKTLYVTLKDVHGGISRGKPFDLAVELVPKHLVPKGMIVIPEMEVYIGDDPTQIKASPFEMTSQPQHKAKIGPFLIDKYLTTVRDYREFLEARLKGLQQELDQDPRLRQGKKDQIIKDKILPLIPGDPFTKKTMINLKKRIASAMGKFRKKSEPQEEEDQFYWRLIKVKEEGKKVWRLNAPKNPVDHHGFPIDGRKPINAITPSVSLEFLIWRTQRDHIQEKKYRLGKIIELEGTARGGFPLIYPFGDVFDPFKAACRSCIPDIQNSQVSRVGRHPVTGITGDRSPLGPLDVIGNVREFSSTEAEQDAIFVFGGSVSIYNGTSFKPSNRPPMLVYAKYDAYGFRKVLDLPPKNKNRKD